MKKEDIGVTLSIILTIVPIALCVLSIPLWIMGVPGIENEYARAWEEGLRNLYYYIGYGTASLVVYVVLYTRFPIQTRGHFCYLVQFAIGTTIFIVAMTKIFSRM